MINTKKNTDLNIMVYSMLLFSLIMDMGGSFGVKNISFIILVIYLVVISFTKPNFNISYNFILIEGSLFCIIPLVLVFISSFNLNVDIRSIIGGISAYILWLLYPILKDIEPKELINKFKCTIYISSWLVIFSFVGIYFLHLIGRSDLIWSITEYSREYSIGFLGERPLMGNIFIPSVFYRWTFLLIPGTLLFIKDSKYKFLICVTAILLTISTGTILFTFIGLIWVLFAKKKIKIKGRKVIPFIILIILIIGFLSLYYSDLNLVINFILGKFSIEDPSTSIKAEHINSILEVILSDVKTLLFGMGIGSSFYTTGTESMVVNVEVSHFNLIRQFGSIYALAFFTYIFSVCYKLSKTDENGTILAIGIICIFFASGTNPLLLSPVFFLPLVIGRSYITSYRIHSITTKMKEYKN